MSATSRNTARGSITALGPLTGPTIPGDWNLGTASTVSQVQTSIASKLSKDANDVLGATVTMGSLGAFQVGTISFNGSMQPTSGSGVCLTTNGLVGIKAGSPTFTITNSGDAVFSGTLSAATGTFGGILNAATGVFAGTLSAAVGTFSGALSAASGTFTGTLSAASGTFTGNVLVSNPTAAGFTVTQNNTASLNKYYLEFYQASTQEFLISKTYYGSGHEQFNIIGAHKGMLLQASHAAGYINLVAGFGGSTGSFRIGKFDISDAYSGYLYYGTSGMLIEGTGNLNIEGTDVYIKNSRTSNTSLTVAFSGTEGITQTMKVSRASASDSTDYIAIADIQANTVRRMRVTPVSGDEYDVEFL